MQIHAFGNGVHRAKQMFLKQGKKPFRWRLLFRLHLLQRFLQNLGKINLYGIVHRKFLARNTHPVAADGNSLAGGFFIYTVFHISVAQIFIIAEPGPAVFIFKQIVYGFFQKRRIAVFMHADGQITGNIDSVGRFQSKVREVICQVTVILIHTGELIIMRVDQKQIGKKKDRRFIL